MTDGNQNLATINSDNNKNKYDENVKHWVHQVQLSAKILGPEAAAVLV